MATTSSALAPSSVDFGGSNGGFINLRRRVGREEDIFGGGTFTEVVARLPLQFAALVESAEDFDPDSNASSPIGVVNLFFGREAA